MSDTRGSSLLALAALAAIAWCTVAGAETRDHLKCYRADDATEAVTAADIETLPFGLDEGCTLESKVREVCVPATADVLAPGERPLRLADGRRAALQASVLARDRCRRRAPSAAPRCPADVAPRPASA